MSDKSLSSLPSFDPRRVPVTGIDAHLPAVPPERLLPAALQRRFASPPDWQAEVVAERRFLLNREPAHASVLVPLVLPPAGHGVPSLLLTERASGLSTHGGQVAFPGGRADPGDRDAADTALREAFEEVGLLRERVQVIGQLPTYETGSAFIVTPVVGLVQPGSALRPNPDEVADVFEVPLDFLMSPANHRRHHFEWQGSTREWFSMPWQPGPDHKEHFIWGATAGILRNLYRFLMA